MKVAWRLTLASGAFRRRASLPVGQDHAGVSVAGSKAAVAYFAPDRADPAVQRRINQWKNAGFSILAFVFARSSPSQSPPENVFELGRLAHASRLGRLVPISRAAFKLIRHRRALGSVSLFVARNLDNGLLALFARWVSGSDKPLVYEVLDVNRACTEADLLGAILRRIEKWLLGRADLLVVSSPHFVTSYYYDRLGYRGDWILFENKVPRYLDALEAKSSAADPASPAPQDRRTRGTPWRIGWFGYLDDERAWEILRRLAERLPHDVTVNVRGIPYDSFDMERFLADVERLPNVTYGGPYRNPEDLAEVYNSVDIVWSVDCNVPTANSKWLLTNALYEAGYFGKPVLGIASNAVGQFVAREGTGWCLEEPFEDSLAAFVQGLSQDTYEAKRQAIIKRRSELFVETDEIERIWDRMKRMRVHRHIPAPAGATATAPRWHSPRTDAVGLRKIVVMGLFPPPVDGQRLITQSVYERLSAVAEVRRFDIDWHSRFGSAWKPLAALAACFVLLKARVEGYSTLYLAPHSGAGLLLSCLIALTARASGYRITTHYHSYWNIGRHSRLMALFLSLCGPAAIHVVLAPPMARDLGRFYPAARSIATVSNSAFIAARPAPARAFGQRRLRMGHLSNLSREKGVAVVLDCLRRLIRGGADVDLLLAGPSEEPEVSELIRMAQEEFGPRLNYLGRLTGDQVRSFYDQIDVFVFPTMHKHEAEPLVLIDALAAGVPVLATDRGCITYLLGNEGGLALPADEFVDGAIDQVAAWARQPDLLAKASHNASSRFRELHEQSRADFHRLIGSILSLD